MGGSGGGRGAWAYNQSAWAAGAVKVLYQMHNKCTDHYSQSPLEGSLIKANRPPHPPHSLGPLEKTRLWMSRWKFWFQIMRAAGWCRWRGNSKVWQPGRPKWTLLLICLFYLKSTTVAGECVCACVSHFVIYINKGQTLTAIFMFVNIDGLSSVKD